MANRSFSPYRDVREFHRKFGHPAPRSLTNLSKETMRFRRKLTSEEATELVYELRANGSLAKIAAESVDLIYVVLGNLVAMGIPFEPIWAAIHSANMAKKVNPDGGKPIKPDGWKPADVEGILGAKKHA